MNVRDNLRSLRRSVYEWSGNDRYSRPALNDLDAKLARYLPQRGGYFIEAGANDGFTQSNTYNLEKMRGWRGLLVEGIPHLYEQARRRRPASRVVNCALVPADQNGTTVEMVYGNLMSLVAGAMGDPEEDAKHICKAKQHDAQAGRYRVEVPARSLSSLLDEAGVTQIDFFSLDVEGFEAQVLRGIDFRRHRPTYLCIEARDRPAIESVISSHYVPVEQLTSMDVLYKLKS